MACQQKLYQAVLLTSAVQAEEYFTSKLSAHGWKAITLIVAGYDTLWRCSPSQSADLESFTYLPLPVKSFFSLKKLIVNGHCGTRIKSLKPILEAAPNLESLTCLQFDLNKDFFDTVLVVAASLKCELFVYVYAIILN